jgi:hypothetical protein
MDGTQGPLLSPGTVLGERYELVGPLWRDGAIQLYRAQDQVLQRPVAVKICHGGAPSERERFAAEVRWLAGSSGPGRVRVYDIGRHGEDHYAVVELQDVLSAPDDATAPVSVTPGFVDPDPTGEPTEIIGRHSDTAILPLPPTAPAEVVHDVPAPMAIDDRRHRGAWIVGATAAAGLALVIGIALAAGGSPHHDTPPVSATTSTTVTAEVVTQPRVRATTTLPPTTTTTIAPPTTADGFPFDDGTPPGQKKKLEGAAPVTTAPADSTPVDTTPTTALG